MSWRALLARLIGAGLLVAGSSSPGIAAAAGRIVALGGDVTETLFALGAGEQVVGDDLTSEYPQAAAALPKVGYVRTLGAEGVLSLKPDLIIATHDAGPPMVLEQLRTAGVPVEVLPETRNVSQIIAKIRRIGDIVDRSAEAEQLASGIEVQAQQLDQAIQTTGHAPRVVFLMGGGSGGLMAAGGNTAADAAIRLAGGTNAVSGYTGYKPLSGEALVALRPDVLLFMQQKTAEQLQADTLMKLPGVADTPAGRAHRLFAVDGLGLLGFGPRTVEQAAALQQRFARIGTP